MTEVVDDLFDDVDDVVEQLALEERMHVAHEDAEMSLAVAVRHDDGDAMACRAVARSPRPAHQRYLHTLQVVSAGVAVVSAGVAAAAADATLTTQVVSAGVASCLLESSPPLPTPV